MAFVVMLALVVFAGQIWAGSPGPPTNGTIQGPELWGVVVIACNDSSGINATARVKRIVDCEVQTQAITGSVGACPSDESAALYYQFTDVKNELFNLPGTPIITKIKNYQNIAGIVSFDAQIKFFMENP